MNKVEQWKSALLAMEDDSFFDLMRNYLGKIETPFNKQDLIERLIRFFSREESKEKIIDFLSTDDKALLTALTLLGHLDWKKLELLFPHWGYGDLFGRINNLSERFLIYRWRDRFHLSPLLEERLTEEILSPSYLLKRGKIQIEPEANWFDQPLLYALSLFTIENQRLFKIDGMPTRAGMKKLGENFHILFEGDEGEERLRIAFNIIRNLKLINQKEGRLNHKSWKQLASFNYDEKLALFRGAALARSAREVNSCCDFISSLLSSFPEGISLSLESLRPALLLFGGEDSLWSEDRIVKDLQVLGILKTIEDQFSIGSAIRELPESSGEPPLIIHANFEITLKPFIPMEEAYPLLDSLSLIRYERFSHYKLTRERVLTFCQSGDMEELLERLERLSGKELPQNVIISLRDWKEEQEKVKLSRGIILKLSADKALLVDGTEHMKPYIREKIAPGIYLLDEKDLDGWTEALKSLSISPLPPLDDGTCHKETEEAYTFSTPTIPSKGENNALKWNSESPENGGDLSSLEKKLRSTTMAADEKQELGGRIKRKLILFPEQINKGIIRPEITEAKGMNYRGKIRLIEGVIGDATRILEVSHYERNGIVRELVRPTHLQKSDDEATLTCLLLPDEEKREVRVSKISRVKIIRNSLF